MDIKKYIEEDKTTLNNYFKVNEYLGKNYIGVHLLNINYKNSEQ